MQSSLKHSRLSGRSLSCLELGTVAAAFRVVFQIFIEYPFDFRSYICSSDDISLYGEASTPMDVMIFSSRTVMSAPCTTTAASVTDPCLMWPSLYQTLVQWIC